MPVSAIPLINFYETTDAIIFVCQDVYLHYNNVWQSPIFQSVKIGDFINCSHVQTLEPYTYTSLIKVNCGTPN